MAIVARLKRQSTLTGVAAVTFTAAVVLLLVALFRNADAHGGRLFWVATGLFLLTIVLWFGAARVGGTSDVD